MLKTRLYILKFRPTPPRREVTRELRDLYPEAVISIHTSPKGGDQSGQGPQEVEPKISIHTSPKGGDTSS